MFSVKVSIFSAKVSIFSAKVSAFSQKVSVFSAKVSFTIDITDTLRYNVVKERGDVHGKKRKQA